MAAVLAERFGEAEVFVGESSMVVDINEVVCLCVSFQAFVDVDDGLARIFDFPAPRKLRARRDGTDDGCDAIGLGKIAHGDDVFDDLLRRHPIIVVCHIVGAGHDDHGLGMEVDDISREPHQHLCRGLSADAPTAEIVAAEEVRVEIGPVVGDGVAHKDHLGVVAAFNDAFVVGLITVEAEPVL